MAVLLTDQPHARKVTRPKISNWLAVPSIAGALVFTVGWLIVGWVQDHYNPRSDYISSLAAVGAANPWPMIFAIVTFGVGVVSLGVGLVSSLEDPIGRVGSIGIMVSGLCVLLVGAMRQDCGVQLPECSMKVSMGDVSGIHAIHDVAGVAMFTIAGVSQLLISRSVRRRERWRHLMWPSVASGILTLLLFVLMGSGLVPEWVGAIQRSIAVISSFWVVMLGVHLLRLNRMNRAHERERALAHVQAQAHVRAQAPLQARARTPGTL